MNRRNKKKKYLVYTNKKYLVSIYSLFKESEKNYMHATFQNIPVFFFKYLTTLMDNRSVI